MNTVTLKYCYCNILVSGVPSNVAPCLPSMVPYWIHMELQQFPLILQKGNNSRGSPKGERLRMSVRSVQKASVLSNQRHNDVLQR